jgi:hypothetical protein
MIMQHAICAKCGGHNAMKGKARVDSLILPFFKKKRKAVAALSEGSGK